ncbi:beta/alpha barrel domain-containing protein [Leptospira borgpetersenii]|nr:4-hydroxy-2-oxovalerate aldolase [Leptospira borgpetersenii]MBE8398958.1 4-hydroxy-2-oxovalerate aldolase [Leptospira borgpetersenii serovar Tarassovi]MBE8402063.1 4-hydroxy-2-oxovalerate aldolase [Leptospira borgpetersenii serovar Tarassovi]MBE8406327.1 4-hydroxy-2-oxovalerate aldolase [Leptospira borgpetersenii serovar Tarassovi]MBE8413933.1 4-hydroxy-2-oxovalerate aldolase [Leptospira borgpetersenii serovar Tarassovi]MBE8414911.1 4-hydroxy-2-oxovalerate aldolase [Leptospira borgpeterseni
MINIIENTLRDGSYVIDFQFDRNQTSVIAKGLNQLGFTFIEVGHGLGLGAWNNEQLGKAKETDIVYIKSSVEAAPEAKIGVFFIPGIGTQEDIDLAVDAGIKFLRIGTNVDTFKKAKPFAEYAKKKGLFVTVNLMKSYGVKFYEFAKIARFIDEWGVVDVTYLVDSAGCMLPDEVFEYIDQTKECVSNHLGFHGHNNLSMAIANSLKAIQAGATFIDTSVRGMGRSAGNAQTEILVYFLQKLGISPIDTEIYKFYDFANKQIVPLLSSSQGLTDEEIHIGVSRFHTSYMSLATKIANLFCVDKKELIKLVSDINCINPNEALFEEIAIGLQKGE